MNRNDSVDLFASISPAEIVHAAWSRRTSIVVVGGLLMAFALLVLILLPNRYVSNAQLLVRLGPGAVSMDPTTGLSKTVSLQESRLSQVNSVAELLRSKRMVEQVAAKVGPKRITEASDPISMAIGYLNGLIPEKTIEDEGGLSADEIKRLIAIAEACREIEDEIEIHPAKNAYTINISYVADSPFLARDVVAAFVEEYPEYHNGAHQPAGSVQFFETEAEQAFGRAKKLQEQVSELKGKHGIIDLDSAKLALREEMVGIQREINSVESDLSSVDAKLNMLASEMGSMPSTIQSETVLGISKPSGDIVRGRFYELEVQAQELASKYKRSHPKRVALESQLKAAREIVDEEVGDQVQSREVVNPNLQSLDLAFRTATAERSGLEAKLDALNSQMKNVNEELVELNQIGSTLTQMTWDANVAESTYVETASRLASARQIAALSSQQMSDVSVAQSATLELKKVGPKRALLAILALGLSTIAAVGQAALRGLIWPDDRPQPEKQHSGFRSHQNSPPQPATARAVARETTDQNWQNPANQPPVATPVGTYEGLSNDPVAYFDSLKKRPR